MSLVELNSTVKVHYTGKLENGEVFDSSEGRDPLQFKVGAGMTIFLSSRYRPLSMFVI
jgi:peptidylprolyl isomerase